MGDAFAGSGAMPPGMIPTDGFWAAVCEVPAMTRRNPWIFKDFNGTDGIHQDTSTIFRFCF